MNVQSHDDKSIQDYRLGELEKTVALGFDKVEKKLDEISSNRPSKMDVDNQIKLALVPMDAELNRLKLEKESRDKWNNRIFAILGSVVSALLITVIGNLLVNGVQQ